MEKSPFWQHIAALFPSKDEINVFRKKFLRGPRVKKKFQKSLILFFEATSQSVFAWLLILAHCAVCVRLAQMVTGYFFKHSIS